MEWFKSLVRPITTYALVAAVIWGFVTCKIESQVFIPLVTLALVFWYKDREQEKMLEQAKK